HFAELHFRLGRCYLALGQIEQAQARYQLSRDWDALQFRADSRRNQIIREVVSRGQGAGISLVDGERVFAENPLSEHQLPGSRLFNDHVHMSFDGDYALASAFFPAVVAAMGLTNAHGSMTASALPSRSECAERLAFTSWEE